MVRDGVRALPLPIGASLVLGCLVLSGCDAGSYEVAVSFDPGSLADDARAVELALVADCAAQRVGERAVDVIQSQTLTRAGGSMALQPVAPGSYGLYGRALSGDCEVVAAGCAEVDVVAGGSGTLSVTLRPRTAAGCAAGVSCDDGVCVEGRLDGGERDAGPDDGGGACAGGCDDSVVCTADSCVDGSCMHVPDDDACGDGEICQLAMGCAVECVDDPDCDDGEECTDDACDNGRCAFTTRDADDDGFGDARCPEMGGLAADDCDDGDALIFSGALERCNGEDDDCDSSTDEDFLCALGAARECFECGRGQQTCNPGCGDFGPCGPRPDVVSRWTFDAEPDPSRFTDRAGTHHGDFRNVATTSPAAVPGALGCRHAMLFSQDGWGEVADSSDFDLASGTFRAWVRFTADDVFQGVFSRDAVDFVTPGQFTITRLDTDVLEARIQDGTRSFFRCTSAAVLSGRWLELEVRFGPPDFEFLIDGIAVDGCTLDRTESGIVGAANPLVFGASQQFSDQGTSVNSGRELRGEIDQVEFSSHRADPARPEITNIVLVDAERDRSIGALNSGAVLTLSELPALNIRVTTDPAIVGSVGTQLDDEPERFEGAPPYALGDDNGDFSDHTPAPGDHTLTVRAFTGPSGTGTPGPASTVTFTVR